MGCLGFESNETEVSGIDTVEPEIGVLVARVEGLDIADEEAVEAEAEEDDEAGVWFEDEDEDVLLLLLLLLLGLL